VLTLNAVTKSYAGPRSRQVLRDVSLTVGDGEFVAIMGESGAGKSTLLNLIAGLDLPDAGSVVLDGTDLSALDDNARTRLRRHRMGFVFQAIHLLPHLTLDIAEMPRDQANRRVGAILEAVGILKLANDFPRSISGGEAQRAAIARALVHEPQLMLADEPTGNLDREAATQVLTLLREQVKQRAGGGILVTHSGSAARTADRVYVLTQDGLAVQTG
jgi:putative ABC transport system ATP-binding protein